MADAQRYKDKVVIITGGSKGIGEGCVRVFVRHGAKVAFCARGVEDGKKLEEDVNSVGPGKSYFKSVDVTDEVAIKAFVDEVIQKYGRIDCLINNAGQHPLPEEIDETAADDFRQLFNLNVVSYFLMAKHCLPELRKVQGSIINDSSMVSKLGQRAAVSYATSKGAIDAMTRALAVDEARYHVRVNTISPSNIWTPLWNWLASKSGTEEDRRAMIEGGTSSQVLGRMGTIEEVGMACLFLAADATFCTGIDLFLSGGSELDYANKSKNRDSAHFH